MRAELRRAAVGLLVVAAACATRSAGPTDELLAGQVRAALSSASDVPGSQLTVDVEDGIVILGGSLACEECGGQATPGGNGTVAQSVGAIVRAIPGVRGLEFRTEPDP